MYSYFSSVIASFISMFFTCYAIYWIVSLFRSVKGPKIAFILITLDVLAHLSGPISSIANMDSIVNDYRNNGIEITNDTIFELYVIYIANIVVILAAYFSFIYLFYTRNLVFKSARAKQFEREYNRKSNVLLNISRTIFLLFGLSAFVLAILLFVKKTSNMVIMAGLFLILVSVFLFYLFARTFVGIKRGIQVKTKQEKTNDYYFIIITDFATYLYQSNSDLSFKEALNGLDSYYYIDEYGYIKGAYKKVVYGIRISNISEEELGMLNMERIYNDKLEHILSSLDKVHQKVITVDEEFNVISETNR